MLSSWIWLCALSKAVMAIRQPEDDQALQQEVEFFDRPLTPSFRPEMLISDDEKVPPIPSALLEQQGCSKQYKSTGKLLGKGNWGTVYEVEEQGSKKHFALKMVSASSQQGKAVMEHEAQVMLAANQHNCSHVVPMITPAPCVDGKQQHYSFVTTLLPYDLFKWRNQQTSRVKLQHCYPVVAKAVYDGLKCLHASGYIHGDLKDDNILFKDFDADGCPSGIVLGDLGLAQKIGSSIYKFHASNYAGSSHLVASLFDGQSDPLGINTMVRVQGTYVNAAIVQAKIDYCSWAMMVTYIFGLPEDKDLTKMLGKGSCGPMGPGRRKLYP